MVHVFNSYVTVTWLPPLCADPMSNVPVSLIIRFCNFWGSIKYKDILDVISHFVLFY